MSLANLSYSNPFEAAGMPALPEGVLSADALQIAGYDFQVGKRPALFQGRDGLLRDSGRFATVRTDTEEALGIVGQRYEVVQYRQALDVADALVEGGQLAYRFAGSYNGGASVFLSALVVGGRVVVAGHDESLPYLTISASHDGTSGVVFSAHVQRIVCWNTYAMAMTEARGRGSVMSFRHTGDVHKKIQAASKAVAAVGKRMEVYSEIANAAAKVSLTEAKAQAFVHGLIPIPEDGKSHAKAETTRANIMELFNGARDLQVTGIRGSLYAAFQAVVAYVDHLRGQSKPGLKRLQSAMVGSGQTLKAAAFQQVRIALDN